MRVLPTKLSWMPETGAALVRQRTDLLTPTRAVNVRMTVLLPNTRDARMRSRLLDKYPIVLMKVTNAMPMYHLMTEVLMGAVGCWENKGLTGMAGNARSSERDIDTARSHLAATYACTAGARATA